MLDDRLVADAVGGSKAALDRLLAALVPRVRAMVVTRLSGSPGCGATTEELTQNALIALSDGISRLERPTVNGLNAFLSGIVSHKVRDAFRGAPPIGGGVASLDTQVLGGSSIGPLWRTIAGRDPTPSGQAAAEELQARLLEQLGRMNPRHREVIILSIVDRLDTEAIAERMDLSRKAASMLLLRAIESLKKRLAEGGGDDGDREEDGGAAV